MESLIDSLIQRYSKSFRASEPIHDHRRVLAGRLQDCLKFQRRRFQTAQISNVEEVVSCLQKPQLVKNRKLVDVESDVLGDVSLAQSFVEKEQPSIDEFLIRYLERSEEYVSTAKFHPVQGRHYSDEFILQEIFGAPRPNSPPRLDGFDGKSVLWSFIRICLKRHYLDWVDKVKRETEIEQNQALESESYDSPIELPEERAEREIDAIERVNSILPTIDSTLTETEQAIVRMMAHEYSNNLIAQVLGKSPGRISHIKRDIRSKVSAALKDVVDANELTELLDELPDVKKTFVANVLRWMDELDTPDTELGLDKIDDLSQDSENEEQGSEE